MVVNEITEFEAVRPQVRAYLCLLLSRSIPNYLPNPSLEVIKRGIKSIQKEAINIEAIYVMDAMGNQIGNNFSKHKKFRIGDGRNHSSRAYYYRAAKEKKCVITNPYPSLLTNDLTVTASYPVYDDKRHLKYIISIDISLKEILHIAHPASFDRSFATLSKVTYGIFSVALAFVSFLLFFHGVLAIASYGFSIEKLEIKQMFEATILLTLSLAIFDLVKTIFEEEVLKHHDPKNRDIHRTMIKFLGSIIIALAIEALMLVFKFAIIGPEKIIYSVYLLGGIALLLFGLSFYLKSTEKNRS
jgi:hypothetical protein